MSLAEAAAVVHRELAPVRRGPQPRAVDRRQPGHHHHPARGHRGGGGPRDDRRAAARGRRGRHRPHRPALRRGHVGVRDRRRRGGRTTSSGSSSRRTGRAMTVLKEGVGMIVDSLTRLRTLRLRELARFGPALYAPMMLRGEGRGVILLLRRIGAPEFDQSDLAMAESVAGQAAARPRARRRPPRPGRRLPPRRARPHRPGPARPRHPAALRHRHAARVRPRRGGPRRGDRWSHAPRAVADQRRRVRQADPRDRALAAPAGHRHRPRRAAAPGGVAGPHRRWATPPRSSSTSTARVIAGDDDDPGATSSTPSTTAWTTTSPTTSSPSCARACPTPPATPRRPRCRCASACSATGRTGRVVVDVEDDGTGVDPQRHPQLGPVQPRRPGPPPRRDASPWAPTSAARAACMSWQVPLD